MSDKSHHQKQAEAWRTVGAGAGHEHIIKDLMYDATANLVVPGDPIATGQKIGRRDLALEILSKIGAV